MFFISYYVVNYVQASNQTLKANALCKLNAYMNEDIYIINIQRTKKSSFSFNLIQIDLQRHINKLNST